MVANCGICGQFTGQTAEKTVRFRGLDRRDGIERVETGSTDVFIGECCGLELIESGETDGEARSYQRYLNETADGELRYVMLIEGTAPPTEIEAVDSVSMFGTSMKKVEVEGVTETPITGSRLPDTVKEYFVGKIE